MALSDAPLYRSYNLLLTGALALLPAHLLDAAEHVRSDHKLPPNFVFILVDDMRWDVMSCAGHPFVRTPSIDRIAQTGVRFGNAFVTTSLCSPSRASFLTGVHAHIHGVTQNEKMEIDPAVPTYAQLLQRSGYETAFVGKWHMSGDPNPRPGFDYWLSFSRQGVYVDPELNENGQTLQAKGYITDLLTDYAVRFIARPHDRPFCLSVSHKAMHAEFTPAERHKDLYDPSLIRAPKGHADDLAGKPRWQREQAVRGGQLKKPVPPSGIPDALEPAPWDPRDPQNARRLDWYRTLAAVDEGVGRILDALREQGLADNTLVLFAGDNGFFLGEHRRGDKRLAYEESIRIPLLIGGAGVTRPARVVSHMVVNIDLAPTLLDWAGVPVPAGMQGRSLKPFLQARTPDAWRESFLYAYYREDWLPGVPTMLGVRTNGLKYVCYPDIDDIDELYDLQRDPQEMTNLAGDPSAAGPVSRMRTELERLLQTTRWLSKNASAGSKCRCLATRPGT